MKSKWKSGKYWTRSGALRLFPFVTGLATAFLISSCNESNEHRHISTDKPSELDGMEQPANQSVFSDLKTIAVSRQAVTPVIRATGVISYDPRLFNNISARFNGRIEKLYVRFNFENVQKGQRIMDIYSPEILTAQQELLFAITNSAPGDELIQASIQKLRLLGITEAQIKQMVASRKLINPIPIYSPYSGHIHDIGTSGSTVSSPLSNSNMDRGMNGTSSSPSPLQLENLPSSQTSSLTIKEGMYIQSGQAIFSVYNISRVWAVLNIYPQDAAWVKVGDKIEITAETNPSHVISAAINYIEPIAGQNASSIKARVYLENSEELHLKIGTFLTAHIKTRRIDGTWLPRKAVVNLGQKQVVFKRTKNYFIAKRIKTGIVTDSLVQIISGLNGNELVAADAQFMVDSESFIQTENDEQY